MADLTRLHSSLAHAGRLSLRHWLGGKPLNATTDVTAEVRAAFEECKGGKYALTIPNFEGNSHAVVAFSEPLDFDDNIVIESEGGLNRRATYYAEFRYIGEGYQEYAMRFSGGACNLSGFLVNGSEKCRDSLVLENAARSHLFQVSAGFAVRHANWISAPGSANCDSITLDECSGYQCGHGHCCSTEGTAYEITEGQLWQGARSLHNHPTVVATVGSADGLYHNYVQFQGLNFTPTTAQLGNQTAVAISPGDCVILLVDGEPEFHHFADTAPASSDTITLNGVSDKVGYSFPAIICSGSPLAIGPANDANLIRVLGGAYRLCGGSGVSGQGFYGSYFEQVEVTETFGPGYTLGWRSSEGRNIGGTAIINPYVGDGLFLGGVGPWLYSAYAPGVNVTGGVLYSGAHMAMLGYPAFYATLGRGGAWKGHEILPLFSNMPEE